MLRMPLGLLLSLALHIGLGWLLQGQWLASGRALAEERFAPVIQLVSLAPPPVMPQPVAPPRPPVAEPAKVARPVAQAKPKPPKSVAPSRLPARDSIRSPATAESRRSTNAKVESPAAAPPAPIEVLSQRPSFSAPPLQPRYPAQARRRNQQGRVLLEVRLDEHGVQRSLRLVRSSGVESLDQAALKAVAGWRFNPEKLAGRAVPSRVQIPIEFALTANR